MGRPKGSTNKPKTAQESSLASPAVEAYKPEPVVLPPEPKKLVCREVGCGHGEETHYGSADRWCNVSGCVCQKFNS